jgi:hypothetical protein
LACCMEAAQTGPYAAPALQLATFPKGPGPQPVI